MFRSETITQSIKKNDYTIYKEGPSNLEIPKKLVTPRVTRNNMHSIRIPKNQKTSESRPNRLPLTHKMLHDSNQLSTDSQLG